MKFCVHNLREVFIILAVNPDTNCWSYDFSYALEYQACRSRILHWSRMRRRVDFLRYDTYVEYSVWNKPLSL